MNSDTRMPAFLIRSIAGSSTARLAVTFQPWSEVACSGSSGTKVTWSGAARSTSVRKSSDG